MSVEINTDDFWKEIDKRSMTHKEEIALLRSELAALKAENEWQPIETAPKYGTVFLAWRKHATHPLMVRYDPSYDWFANYDGEHVYDLTHWMPLPKPPAMAQGEKG